MKVGIIDSLYAVPVSINCVSCIYMKFTDKLQTYFSFWVFFANIHDSQDSRGKRSLFL